MEPRAFAEPQGRPITPPAFYSPLRAQLTASPNSKASPNPAEPFNLTGRSCGAIPTGGPVALGMPETTHIGPEGFTTPLSPSIPLVSAEDDPPWPE